MLFVSPSVSMKLTLLSGTLEMSAPSMKAASKPPEPPPVPVLVCPPAPILVAPPVSTLLSPALPPVPPAALLVELPPAEVLSDPVSPSGVMRLATQPEVNTKLARTGTLAARKIAKGMDCLSYRRGRTAGRLSSILSHMLRHPERYHPACRAFHSGRFPPVNVLTIEPNGTLRRARAPSANHEKQPASSAVNDTANCGEPLTDSIRRAFTFEVAKLRQAGTLPGTS